MEQVVKYLPKALRYALRYWKLAVVLAVATTLVTLVSLLTPWPMKILVDNVLGNQPLSSELPLGVGWLGEHRLTLLLAVVAGQLSISLVMNLLGVISSYATTKLELGMNLDCRSDLFQHAQRLSMSYHDQRRSGMLIYIVNSMGSAPASLIMTILPLAQNILTLVGMFWISFHLDRGLALLSLTVIPFLYYSVSYYATHIKVQLQQVRAMEGEMLAIIHEALSMLRVIVAFGREDHEFRRFREQGERAVDARVKLTVRQSLFSLAVNTTTAIGTTLVLGFGAYHVLQSRLTVGELLIVMAYIGSVYKPLQSISNTIGALQEHLINMQMAFDLLDTDLEIKDQEDAIHIERAQGRVAFEGVHFSYQKRTNTLKDISIEAQAGQVIAIVGPTGAGKTTLVSLLPRFYDLNTGCIRLDGLDIRKLKIKSLRQQISIVLQEPLLFSGSIADNIHYGRLDASMNDIIEAAKAANAHHFILDLPDQYETELGERGASLSVGERQRIAVARAFLKDAPILILDEPTSSIDSKTEAVILDALDRLMIGRTTFMVAHRLSTIRNADLILVLNHGELVEQGTHDHLLKSNGLYQQLYEVQNRQMRNKSSLTVQPEAISVAG